MALLPLAQTDVDLDVTLPCEWLIIPPRCPNEPRWLAEFTATCSCMPEIKVCDSHRSRLDELVSKSGQHLGSNKRIMIRCNICIDGEIYAYKIRPI